VQKNVKVQTVAPDDVQAPVPPGAPPPDTTFALVCLALRQMTAEGRVHGDAAAELLADGGKHLNHGRQNVG
jgi:hypothetical protein